jgi:hypothetical protein
MLEVAGVRIGSGENMWEKKLVSRRANHLESNRVLQ